jgi:hypothetical protein
VISIPSGSQAGGAWRDGRARVPAGRIALSRRGRGPLDAGSLEPDLTMRRVPGLARTSNDAWTLDPSIVRSGSTVGCRSPSQRLSGSAIGHRVSGSQAPGCGA